MKKSEQRMEEIFYRTNTLITRLYWAVAALAIYMIVLMFI